MTYNLKVYQELYPDSETINASELFRKRRTTPANTNMIRTGEARLELCRKCGDTMEDEAQYRIVIYDKEYAIAKVSNDLKSLLGNFTLTDFINFLTTVFTQFQKERENDG